MTIKNLCECGHEKLLHAYYYKGVADCCYVCGCEKFKAQTPKAKPDKKSGVEIPEKNKPAEGEIPCKNFKSQSQLKVFHTDPTLVIDKDILEEMDLQTNVGKLPQTPLSEKIKILDTDTKEKERQRIKTEVEKNYVLKSDFKKDFKIFIGWDWIKKTEVEKVLDDFKGLTLGETSFNILKARLGLI